MSDTTWRLVTVNTAPDRAKRLIGRVAEKLKDRYTIEHVANAECMCRTLFENAGEIINYARTAIDKVEPTVKEHMPNLLVSRGLCIDDVCGRLTGVSVLRLNVVARGECEDPGNC